MKVNFETLQEESNYNSYRQCYLTLQEILDKRERKRLLEKIKAYFSSYGNIDISIEQLRKIEETINTK